MPWEEGRTQEEEDEPRMVGVEGVGEVRGALGLQTETEEVVGISVLYSAVWHITVLCCTVQYSGPLEMQLAGTWASLTSAWG